MSEDERWQEMTKENEIKQVYEMLSKIILILVEFGLFRLLELYQVYYNSC